jgi:hypothetical protein
MVFAGMDGRRDADAKWRLPDDAQVGVVDFNFGDVLNNAKVEINIACESECVGSDPSDSESELAA